MKKLSYVKPWLEELIEFSDFAYLHKLCSGTVMRQDGRILRDIVEQLLPQFQQYEGAEIDLQKLDDLLHDADMMVTLNADMTISARENPYDYLDDLVAQWERKFQELTRTHVSDEDQKSYAFLSVEGQLNTLKILRSVLDDSNKRGLDRLILSNFGITGETDAEGGAKEVMSALFFLTLLDLRHKPDMPMGIPLCLLGEARETVLEGLVTSLNQLYSLGKDSVFMQRQNGIVTLLQGPSDLSKENGALAARVFINQAAIDGTREMLIQVPGSNPKVTMAVGPSRGRVVPDGISGSGTAAFAMQYVGAFVKQPVGLTPSEQLRYQLFQAIRSRKVSEEGSYHPLPSSATVQESKLDPKWRLPKRRGSL